jgi:hypothetical protein
MTDEAFDLEAYLASNQKLEFDPELARETITFIPGDPPPGFNPTLAGEREAKVFYVNAILDSASLNEAPYEMYPFIPPTILRWRGISARKRADIASRLLNSRIVYDETHPRATIDTNRDLAWSRVLIWYLVTTIAGNVPVEVRRDGDHVGTTVMADDLIRASDKAVMSLRNSFMTNFGAIGMRIVQAHMPTQRPDLEAFTASVTPGVRKFVRDCSGWSRFAAEASERPFKSFDLWVAHASWLKILFAFGKSTEPQRSVLFHELTKAERHEKIVATLGDSVVSDTFVHPDRGQVLRNRECGGFILEMIVRGFVAVDMEAKTIRLTDEGHSLVSALSPLEDSFRYWEFIDRDDDTVDPDRLASAHAWIIEFFTAMKKIADEVVPNKDATE